MTRESELNVKTAAQAPFRVTLFLTPHKRLASRMTSYTYSIASHESSVTHEAVSLRRSADLILEHLSSSFTRVEPRTSVLKSP